MGTLLSIIIYYFEDILELLIYWRKNLKYIMLIILGSIPTAIIGFTIYKLTDNYNFGIKAVGGFFLITSIFLFLVDRFQFNMRKQGNLLKRSEGIGVLDALFIGSAQGVAVFPGISRSGFTVGSAILRKIDPKDAAKFSFLLSIPAIGGAFLLEFIHKNMTFEGKFLVPMFISFIVGYAAIHIFIKILTSKRLIYFTLYLLIISIISLLFL